MEDPFDIFVDYGTSFSEKKPPDIRIANPTFSADNSINDLVNTDDVIFDCLNSENDLLSVTKFFNELRIKGLKKTDPRLKELNLRFRQTFLDRVATKDELNPFNFMVDRQTFKYCIQENRSIISKALRGNLVIPEWREFCKSLHIIYNACRSISQGQKAKNIPQLTRVSADKFGISVCTVDGQRASFGDFSEPWCLQSVSKPLTYGIALNEYGSSCVHAKVGEEPSGRLFNEICLDHNSKPHNPFINAGAIVVASLIKPAYKIADRFDFIVSKFKQMAGGEYVGFSNTTFQSERETADRNWAISYYLREHNCFEKDVKLDQTLDLYFQICSVEVTCESAAVIAATLANGGMCPLTNCEVLKNRPVRDVLSLMYSCGMYDYSGQFAFQIGLPAKSGVSGGMILVVPNVVGFAIWSPPLDSCRNPVRGVEFCKQLVDTFNFHNYDNLVHGDYHKIDPRKRNIEVNEQPFINLLWGAAKGHLNIIKRLVLQGVDINGVDYDRRSALHMAASEGHSLVVSHLLKECRAKSTMKDRWGKTALDNAKEFGFTDVVKIIEDYEGRPSTYSAAPVPNKLQNATKRIRAINGEPKSETASMTEDLSSSLSSSSSDSPKKPSSENTSSTSNTRKI